MMKFKTLLLTLILLNTLIIAAPAVGGTRTFTQPDGTKFEGILKGDSSFNWIESDGNIVKYNSKDKFYYKAVVDENNSIKLTNEKPTVKVDNMSSSSSNGLKKHDITQESRKKINKVYKKSKTGNYPK